MRDAEARRPTLAQNCMITRMDDMTVAPATDPVEWSRISMYGYPVGVFSAPSTSVKLNSVIISIPNARLPLMKMVNMIERGTTTEASWISSDIYSRVNELVVLHFLRGRGIDTWIAPSAPVYLVRSSTEYRATWDNLHTSKRINRSNKSYHKGQTLRGPVTVIQKSLEHF